MSLTVFVLLNIDEDDDDFTLYRMNVASTSSHTQIPHIFFITSISIYINCNDRDEFCLLNERKTTEGRWCEKGKNDFEQKTQLNSLTNVLKTLKFNEINDKKMKCENIAIV